MFFPAVLHLIENGNREQAKTHGGERRYTVSYPKRRTSQEVAKAVRFSRLSVSLYRCNVSE